MKSTETLFDVLSEQIDFSSKTKFVWMKSSINGRKNDLRIGKMLILWFRRIDNWNQYDYYQITNQNLLNR